MPSDFMTPCRFISEITFKFASLEVVKSLILNLFAVLTFKVASLAASTVASLRFSVKSLPSLI